MGYISSILSVNADDRAYVNTIGQQRVYEVAAEYLARRQAEIAATTSALISSETEIWQEQFVLPSGGRMHPIGGMTDAPAHRSVGSWTVAYPLKEFGNTLGQTHVDMAYMPIGEFERQVDGIVERSVNTLRYEILRRLLKNTTDSVFEARPAGATLTIQPLANGDTVVYPPVEGSETEATDNHYLVSGYAASGINDTNNPLVLAADELIEHFPISTGGNNIVVFINNAQTALISALTEFDSVVDNFIRAGGNTDIPFNLPNVPGKIIGRTNVSGVWVVEWRWMPANYMFATNLEVEAPLKMRVDQAASGLQRGLHMHITDPNRPIQTAEWKYRFGIGCANRLNGVVVQLKASGTYDIPSAYA